MPNEVTSAGVASIAGRLLNSRSLKGAEAWLSAVAQSQVATDDERIAATPAGRQRLDSVLAALIA